MRPISPSFVAPLSLVVFAFSALHVDTASADIVTIQPVSASSLAATCDKMGGKFTVNSNMSGYSCDKKNCDGKGSQCSVDCTIIEGKGPSCVGATPLKQRPQLATGSKGIEQLLTASPGKATKSGTSAATQRGPTGSRVVNPTQTVKPKSEKKTAQSEKKTPKAQSFSGADRGPRNEGGGKGPGSTKGGGGR
jgi:hypothetical protein